MRFSHGSKARLTAHDLGRFPSGSLFDRLARVVCGVGLLPRKELYEAWEVARRVRRLCRGGRVVDVAGGHGMLAHAMLLLDDSSPEAVVIDPAIPPSAAALHDMIVEAWPRLANRISYVQTELEAAALTHADVVVASHACGSLTDRVIDAAAAARASVAVLPCCHDLATCDAGPLRGWMDAPLAIDTLRALRLESRGYTVKTQSISPEITPKNRLLIAWCPRGVRVLAGPLASHE